MVPEPLRAPRPTGDTPEIPGFIALGVVGRGASGTVYRAREVALDREVALKVLHPEVAKNKQTVRRLQREARTTARLGHPHIVSAIAIGEHEGLHWYAMALIDGPSLSQVLKKDGRLREREALRLFIPLCEALEHLWEHGVVHRDIKPANILIDNIAGAQLADLGLAFHDDDPTLTNQGATLGTPHYISPEQAVDPTRADVKSDIWSFGATLYHAVCGRPPFHGDSTAEVLSSVLHARVPDPLRFEPTLSRGLTLILRKCLTRDPAERYQTPRELLLDLERVRERRAPKVVKSALDPVERAPRPWVTPLVATGVVVLALGAVILAATQLGSPEDAGAGAENVAGPEPFEPLDSLASRIATADTGGRVREPGPILRELEDLSARVPAGRRTDWEGLYARVHSSLRAEVASTCDDHGGRADRLAKAGDFVAARAELEVELSRTLLADTGFAVDELEERFGFLRARRQDLGARLNAAQTQHLRVVERSLPEEVDALIAEADRLREGNRYKSALGVLDVDGEALLESVGYGGWRFEPALVDELLGQATVRLGVKRQNIDFAWRALDSDLRAFVDRRADRLRENLDYTAEPTTSAADDLAASYENELFERGIAREEMPLEITRYAENRLAAAQEELSAYEDELRGNRFRELFELNRDLDASRWQRRDYAVVHTLWSEFAVELDGAPGDATRPWRAELQRRTDARIEEARLLDAMLRRASAGVIARDGERREMRVLGGGILEEGRIQAGIDPLRDGFSLVPERGEPFQLLLTTISTRDLLDFAGFAAIDEDLAPEDRLAAAAFRYHEGELRRADVVLRSGELPTSGAAGELARDLRARIGQGLDSEESRRDERDAEVSRLLSLVTEESIGESPDRALMAIDKLLAEYADVPSVRALRQKLLDDQRRLEERPRRFEEAYGADGLDERPDGTVSMRFEFDGPEVGAWEALGWRYDGAGWAARDVVRDWGALERQGGARLILRPPLDVGREVEARIAFTVVDENAPAQLFAVSLLGFHTAVTGPGLPIKDERRSRWHIASGDLDTFLGEVQRGKGETGHRFLRPGVEQVLVLRVNAHRGTVSLELDGTQLGERSFRGRTPEPLSLVLRSWDPIRVTSVELIGSR